MKIHERRFDIENCLTSYEVDFEITNATRENLDEIYAWCVDQFDKPLRYRTWHRPFNLCFTFYDETMAFGFKMRWM